MCKSSCDLENKIIVTTILSTLMLVTMIYPCKFEENLSTGSQDIPLTRLWPWKWDQVHQNFISSWSWHNNIFRQLWGEIPSTNSKEIPLTRLWLWKWGQGHQNVSRSLACHNDISMQVWRKSIHCFKRYSTYKTMALIIRSMSPKFNQVLSLSLIYNSCKFGENPSTGQKDILLTRLWPLK